MTNVIAWVMSLVYALGLYPTLFEVTAITPIPGEETAIVEFVDANGFTWEYETEIEDIGVGDCYSAIMYSNGTKEIFDDAIIRIWYERPDLLPSCVN